MATQNDGLYKTKKSVAAGKVDQFSYTERAKARKTMDVLVIPEALVADAFAAGVLVGKGNLLRVEGTAAGYITFGPDSTTAIPTAVTANTLKTPAGFFFIVATDEFVRTSALMRIEVVND